MPYRLDPSTGQFVWDGSSIPQTARDAIGSQIRDLQAQIDALEFVYLNDVPSSYAGQAGKILAVKDTEDGIEMIENTGGGGSVTLTGDVTGSGTGTVETTISTVAVAKGGTGATTAPAAVTNLTTISSRSDTGSGFSLSSSDSGTVIVTTATSAINVTVPSGLPAGFNCIILQGGTGQLTFVASGTTLRSFNSLTKSAGIYSAVTVLRSAANTFYLTGAMA